MSDETSLLETIANIAYELGRIGYTPPDSRDIASNAIDWAQSFEAEFGLEVECGRDEGDYIEALADYVAEISEGLPLYSGSGPVDSFTGYCLQRAASGPNHEFWRRLAGSVRKAATM